MKTFGQILTTALSPKGNSLRSIIQSHLFPIQIQPDSLSSVCSSCPKYGFFSSKLRLLRAQGLFQLVVRSAPAPMTVVFLCCAQSQGLEFPSQALEDGVSVDVAVGILQAMKPIRD